MNREEKRQFKKNAKKRGFSSSETDYLLNHKPNLPMLWEGAKVKLDTVWIRLSPDWYENKYRKEYKDWILANKDKEFTVVFDESRKQISANNTIRKDPLFDTIVCLAEDETNPKWIFYAGDLILIPGGTPRPEKKEIREHFEEVQKQLNQEQKIQDAVQLALEREKG